MTRRHAPARPPHATVRPTRALHRDAAALLLAATALALGLAVYTLARPPRGAWLWPAAWTWPVLMPTALPPALQACLGCLPSAMHGLAFALLNLVLLHGGNARPCRCAPVWAVCCGWCLLGLLFEAGQHPRLAQGIADALRGGDAPAVWLEPVARYFTRGTFDVLDLAATVTGCAAAGCLWHGAGRRQANARSKA